MSCRIARNELSAYLDGELKGLESLRLRDHIRTCAACRVELAELKAVKVALERTDDVEVPTGFEERLVSFVMTGNVRERREQPIWRWAALCSATAAVTVFFALQFFAQPEAPQAMAERSPVTESPVFDVSRDQMYVSGSDPFGGPAPALPANHVPGR
jgi:anti-sigma factor RsiW